MMFIPVNPKPRAALLAFCVAGAACAAPALADDAAHGNGPSYDHLDIEYGVGKFDDGDLEYDTDALGVHVSTQVGSNFFVAASYQYAQVDVDDLPGGDVENLDSHTITAGVGAFVRVLDADQAALDLTGEVFFIRSDLENHTDSGWGAVIGPRLRFAQRFEVDAEATYYDIADDGLWTFGVHGQMDVTDVVAVRLGVDVDENNDEVTWRLGARVHLGD